MKVTVLQGLGLFVVALSTTGCNPTGTCMTTDSELGDACTLNMNKKGCEAMSGKFVQETHEQALLRCKSEGYDFLGQSGQASAAELKAGSIVILYKDKSAGKK